MSSSPYRTEIDGLRAVSVLVILLFHLQVPLVGGGFVGVDVFFVISGYLITNILLRELDTGTFSFRQFYLRRFARIVPALVATIGLSLAAATVLFTPRLLEHALQQGLAALFSVSNLFFWADADYWSTDAKGYLLLHTWSLGVEEQFYLFYPLLLFGVFRLGGRRALLLTLVILAVAITAAAEHYLAVDRSAAFYLTPLRLNEFAIGGLGSLLAPRLQGLLEPQKTAAAIGTLLGLGLILHSAYSFSFFTLFPGVDALQPTLGALLVILCGASLPARWLLCNRFMSWLGRRSYSLYLVHWPLIVLYRYALGPHLSPVNQVMLAGCSLVLAMGINRAVERRFRLAPCDRLTRSGMKASHAFRMTGLFMAGICGLAVVGITTGGWPGRMPADMRDMAVRDQKVSPQLKALLAQHCTEMSGVFCGKREANSEEILLLADSRAYDMYTALRTAYPAHHVRTAYALGCPPLLDSALSPSWFHTNCPRLNRIRLRNAVDAPAGTVVFLAMDLSGWRGAATVDTARRLVESGKQVYVLGQTQFLEGKTPRDIVIDQRRWSLDERYIERFLARQPFHLDKQFRAEISDAGATYISNREFFRHDHYRLYTLDGSDLLSYDGKHLTRAGAEEFGRFLARHYPLD